MKSKKKLKICSQGHKFYKSSDCPVCPECEKEAGKGLSGFLALVSAPARRALQMENIDSLHQLTEYTKADIASLHGVGPKVIQIIEKELKANGLHFKLD